MTKYIVIFVVLFFVPSAFAYDVVIKQDNGLYVISVSELLDDVCGTNGQLLKRIDDVWECADDNPVESFFETNASTDIMPLASGGVGTVFEYNGDGDITPLVAEGTDSYFEYNGDGDIMPKA